MVQKEVADRLCAEPGSPEYGAITLAVRFRGTAGKCFTVPAGCFFPPPKVDSAVVRIDLFDRSPFALSEEEKKLFFACVRAAFMQRRKTLGNALAAGFPSLPKEVLRALPEEIGLSRDVRGEALSAESYARLGTGAFGKAAAFFRRTDAEWRKHLGKLPLKSKKSKKIVKTGSFSCNSLQNSI